MTGPRQRGPAADVTFFKTQVELRRWFAKHHASEDVLWVGFYKKESGEPSITWAESVDEALSVGWIDGIRKRIDDRRYKIRFMAAAPRQHLERGQHRARRGAEESPADAPGRPRGLCGPA